MADEEEPMTPELQEALTEHEKEQLALVGKQPSAAEIDAATQKFEEHTRRRKETKELADYMAARRSQISGVASGWILDLEMERTPATHPLKGFEPGAKMSQSFETSSGEKKAIREVIVKNTKEVARVPMNRVVFTARFQLPNEVQVFSRVADATKQRPKMLGQFRLDPAHVGQNRLFFKRADEQSDPNYYIFAASELPAYRAEPVMIPEMTAIDKVIEERVARRRPPDLIFLRELADYAGQRASACKGSLTQLRSAIQRDHPDYFLLLWRFVQEMKFRPDEVFEKTRGTIRPYDGASDGEIITE